MELLNKNLKQKTEEGVEPKEFLKIIKELFILIQNFHYRDLVHRDIKPENFVFNKEHKLCIIDLGLSCLNDRRELRHFIGNKLYSSFNCHLDKYYYNKTDDLISIVYMLLHLYTGILPWDKTPFDYKNNSLCQSLFYDLKKNTNYKEFYKNINKYDNHVKILINVYNKITY